MTAYYNEIDKNACLWLKAAMDAGIIAKGDIDSRPIQEVTADDIRGYTQHHFFAGVGGWSVALRLAGWSDERQVWTGSCPCQPFSTAGRQQGKKDERHLWPHWFRLIKECHPATVFGEQVANAVTFGWLDDVAASMESESYAFASAVLPACSVGAPHRRDRLWFVAHSESGRVERTENDGRSATRDGERRSNQFVIPSVMGNAHHEHQRPTTRHPQGDSNATRASQSCCLVGDTEHYGQSTSTQQRIIGEDARQSKERQERTIQSERTSHSFNMADTCQQGLERHRESEHLYATQRWENASRHFAEDGLAWLPCPDGKARPVEPSICLLVDGIPSKLRKAALHGYGNAIVPQVGAAFIKAYMKCI